MSAIVKTYGAMLLGALTATFLSGMNASQAVLYFRLFPKDPLALKASVSVVWSLDIIHTAFVWVVMWSYFIVYYGQPEEIDVMQMPYLVPGTVVLTVIVTLIVDVFYMQRIFRLSHRNYWISAPILFLALARVGSAVATINEWYRTKKFSVFSASGYKWILSLGLVFGAATDLAIVVTMFILLKTSREKSISLNSVIDQLILYTFEIGSMTALSAVVSMITWFADQHSLAFAAIYICIEKVFAITFLGLLNARHHLRQQNESQNNSQGWKMSRFARMAETNPQSAQMLTKEIPLQEVHVDVTQSIQYDNKSGSNL